MNIARPFVAGLAAGVAGSGLLAAVWNALGWAPPAARGYELSGYFAPISVGFVLAYVAVAFIAGWATRQPKPVALGMLLPIVAAVAVEVSRDRTSHNLIPFEAAVVWLPAFALAFGAACLGRVLRRDTMPA